MLCDSFGCDMPGHFTGTCRFCEDLIIRCGSCRERFLKLEICWRCTGRGQAAVSKSVGGHVDEERDLDANGWLSYALRLLEELRVD